MKTKKPKKKIKKIKKTNLVEIEEVLEILDDMNKKIEDVKIDKQRIKKMFEKSRGLLIGAEKLLNKL